MPDQVEEVAPKMTSPEWTNYVLSKFQPDELYEDSPKVDGLWRVAESLLGLIVNYDAKVIEAPSERNGFSSTVECRLVLRREDGELLTSAGVGDCSPRNADSKFGIFASSFAETRAKGRALRTLLRLRNVVAAEEKDDSDNQFDDMQENITDIQQETIDVLCNKMDLNVVRVVLKVATDLNYKVTTFRTISKAVAGKIIQRLKTYQKDKKLIDDEVKGYKADWKQTKGS